MLQKLEAVFFITNRFVKVDIYWEMTQHPVGIYLLKVNSRNTRTSCEICSKLTVKTPQQRHWRRSGVFIVNFEHIPYLVLASLWLTLSR